MNIYGEKNGPHSSSLRQMPLSFKNCSNRREDMRPDETDIDFSSLATPTSFACS